MELDKNILDEKYNAYEVHDEEELEAARKIRPLDIVRFEEESSTDTVVFIVEDYNIIGRNIAIGNMCAWNVAKGGIEGCGIHIVGHVDKQEEEPA